MMQQADAQVVVSPYAGSGGFPSPSGSGQEPLLSPGQHQQFGYSQQQRHPVYQDWQGGATNSAPIAPLPNGAQGASRANDPLASPTRPNDAT
ncbi:hypothetical protein FRB91_008470 [Serendipita sp. 411]|nr:hypothetical protein FRC18_008969 [Serendipita sp. 400]KAG8836809.1 hypothetical protein FRB91_008470 [Serendipita sp. 411]